MLGYFYAVWSESLDDEARHRLENRLNRPPNLQVATNPGIAIPDWMDLEDLPPGMVSQL